MDGFGSGSCTLAGFGISGVESSVSVARELVISCFEIKNFQRIRQLSHECDGSRIGWPVFGSRQGLRNCFHYNHIQNVSETHSSICLMGTFGSVIAVKDDQGINLIIQLYLEPRLRMPKNVSSLPFVLWYFAAGIFILK